jgi:hypothetical protein
MPGRLSGVCRYEAPEGCRACTGCDHDCHHVPATSLDDRGLRGLRERTSGATNQDQEGDEGQ